MLRGICDDRTTTEVPIVFDTDLSLHVYMALNSFFILSRRTRFFHHCMKFKSIFHIIERKQRERREKIERI